MQLNNRRWEKSEPDFCTPDGRRWLCVCRSRGTVVNLYDLTTCSSWFQDPMPAHVGLTILLWVINKLLKGNPTSGIHRPTPTMVVVPKILPSLCNQTELKKICVTNWLFFPHDVAFAATVTTKGAFKRKKAHDLKKKESNYLLESSFL